MHNPSLTFSLNLLQALVWGGEFWGNLNTIWAFSLYPCLPLKNKLFPYCILSAFVIGLIAREAYKLVNWTTVSGDVLPYYHSHY